ncbi:TPA: diguanylate cyclase [Pseudomonas aeruginosa]|uniref:diguanylate cyclase n=1 Tax=Pseudomonas paraeruginosa TaxID=2994495 RepID=UPI003749BAB7|nr:diguanylate cyclase [Pseudomonas aeruginosa]HBP6820123.1 diguanylate cyclase [Pseudomonas aeruginosa]
MFSGKIGNNGFWPGMRTGALFFLAALACIYLSRQPATIAAIWLPNAILAAALLRAPLRQWPMILFCTALANLAANRLYGDSLWMSAAFLPANLSEATFAAMLLRMNRVREDFDFNLLSAVRVLWAGALVPPLLGASVGAALVSLFGLGSFPQMWARWYVGDAMGMLALLPLCLASSLATWRHGLSGRAGVDNAMLLLATLFISFVALTRLPYSFIYVLLPLLVAAASTSVFGTALIGCLNTCFIAVLIAMGVFAPESSQQRFGEPLLYLPMALTLIPAFLVSVIMERSRREQHQVAIGEAQFRGAMEFSAIGTALVALDGRLFKVNEALCRMLGYPAERLGELTFQAITYAADLELDLDLVRDLLAGRINSYQMEKRYLRQDGETFWARISVSLVRDEEGIAQYFVTQVEDIDSRKRAELERERLAERVKLATDAGQIGIWEWDLRHNRLHWDFRMFDLYGIRSGPGETTVEQWQAALHPDDHERVLHELDRALSGLQKFDCEFRIVRPDRQVRHLRAIATLTRDEDNRPVRMIGINSDITEIRTLAETLYEEKERLQVTLYSIGDAVLTTDAGGRVTFMNPVAEAMTGWTLQDALGAPHELVFNVLDSDTGDTLDSPVRRCLQNTRVFYLEDGATLISRKGEQHDIQNCAAPVRTRDGEIIGTVLVFQNVTKARAMQRELSYHASHDALTGLFNRTKFEEELRRALANAQERASQHALCFIDLDRFKVVNDSAGHAAGDMLLRELSRILADRTRASDTLARLGGDEFGLLLFDCDLAVAEEVASKLIEQICSVRFPWEGRVYDVGASIGITALTATSRSTSELMSQADVACYAAKHAGRNRVSVYQFGHEEVERQHRDILLASGLREALENDRFQLQAQEIVPVVARRDGGRHYELLLRLYDPDGQMTPPGAFIPAAERFNLMASIDRWVINEALINFGPRIAAIDGLTIGINLSGNSLNDPLFLPYLLDRIEHSPLGPERLYFELTETALMNQLSVASRIVDKLRDLGCKVALDDFGSGLSSFNYLKNFAVDAIKIDGSFVRNLDKSPVDQAIVDSINQIAQRLGAVTVAEFVESREILDHLARLGVDYAQGYAVGRPQPFATVLEQLRGARRQGLG